MEESTYIPPPLPWRECQGHISVNRENMDPSSEDIQIVEGGTWKKIAVLDDPTEFNVPPDESKVDEVTRGVGHWGDVDGEGAPGLGMMPDEAEGSKETEGATRPGEGHGLGRGPETSRDVGRARRRGSGRGGGRGRGRGGGRGGGRGRVRRRGQVKRGGGPMKGNRRKPGRVDAGASWADRFARGPPPGTEKEHKATMKLPESGEDDGSDRPRIGSCMEKALTYANGHVEVTDATKAMIISCTGRGRKVLTYRAIIGEGREIDLVPPTHAKKTNEEMELHRLRVGDIVQVREKVEHSIAGAVASWVMIKRARDCLHKDKPQMIARVQEVDPSKALQMCRGCSVLHTLF